MCSFVSLSLYLYFSSFPYFTGFQNFVNFIFFSGYFSFKKSTINLVWISDYDNSFVSSAWWLTPLYLGWIFISKISTFFIHEAENSGISYVIDEHFNGLLAKFSFFPRVLVHKFHFLVIIWRVMGGEKSCGLIRNVKKTHSKGISWRQRSLSY